MEKIKAFCWNDNIITREILPIDYYLEDIIELLKNNQVVIVEGETGSGKTTRIPQAILNCFPEKNIIMTEPRRPVVRWISKRISSEMGSPLGEIIGYRLFGEKPVVSDKTKCLILVDQSIVNKISRTRKLPKGILIVDEAHERYAQLSIDMLMILLKELLPGSPDTKVLITSATLDVEKFSKYFFNAPILRVKGRCYPVEKEILELMPYEHHTQGAVRAVKHVLYKFLEGKLTILDKNDFNQRVVVDNGTCIVFLPGEEDINKSLKEIEEYLQEEFPAVKVVTLASKETFTEDSQFTIELFPCHSKLNEYEQDSVQEDNLKKNTLRFILSTDIARGSVTFPKVVGVIDSLQVKRPSVDINGISQFGKISISMVEADQGMGRAGRTQPGFYIAIGNEYNYLDKWPKPAILREALTSVVLQLILAGINPRTCDYLDNPGDTKIDVAIRRLQRIEALDEAESITELGRLLVRFPIDPEKALSLIKADEFGILPEAVIAISCIEENNIFFLPKPEQNLVVEAWVVEEIFSNFPELKDYSGIFIKRTKEDFFTVLGKELKEIGSEQEQGIRTVAEIIRKSWNDNDDNNSDFSAMINAFRAFKQEYFRLNKIFYEMKLSDKEEIKEARKELKKCLIDWCKRHCLVYKNLLLVDQKISQIREEISQTDLSLSGDIFERSEFSSENLIKALMSGMFDNIGIKSNHGHWSASGEFKIAHNSLCETSVEIAMFGKLRKVHLQGKNFFYNLADLACPVKAEWIKEVLPQFCSYERGDSYFSEKHDKVLFLEETIFNGIVIDRSEKIEEDLDLAEKIREKYFRKEEIVQPIKKMSGWYNLSKEEVILKLREEKNSGKYLSLLAYNYDYFSSIRFHIEIVENEEDKELDDMHTKSNLARLFSDFIEESIQKFDDKSFNFKSYEYGLRYLYGVEVVMKEVFDNLIKRYIPNLTLENIENQIELAKEEVAEVVCNLKKNHLFIKNGLTEMTFAFLMNGKRVQELSNIFLEVQDTLGYSEDNIVKALYSLTKNGNDLVRRGNKLWLSLKEIFPTFTGDVDIEKLSMAIMEEVE